MAISVGSTFSDRRDADLKWHWLGIISMSIFHNCSLIEDAKIFVVRMKTKNDRLPWSNSTPDVNRYVVKLKKDLQVDILSNTGWYLVALGQ